MEKYESKQQQIRRPAAQVYTLLSDFSNFTPALRDRVEEWQATQESCSFRVKGISVRLRIVDRVPDSLVKITGDENAPLDFTLWFQFKELAPDDTRMRIVLHVELNMVMRMMIGSKIQGAIDEMARQIADTFNRAPFPV